MLERKPQRRRGLAESAKKPRQNVYVYGRSANESGKKPVKSSYTGNWKPRRGISIIAIPRKLHKTKLVQRGSHFGGTGEGVRCEHPSGALLHWFCYCWP